MGCDLGVSTRIGAIDRTTPIFNTNLDAGFTIFGSNRRATSCNCRATVIFERQLEPKIVEPEAKGVDNSASNVFFKRRVKVFYQPKQKVQNAICGGRMVFARVVHQQQTRFYVHDRVSVLVEKQPIPDQGKTRH